MKAMTKRTWMMLTSALLAMVLVVALAACGKTGDNQSTGGQTTEAPAGGTTEENKETEENTATENEGAESEEQEGTEEEHLPEEGGDSDFPEADKELAQILSQMYEKVPAVQEIALGDPMPIDLTGEDFSYWLGTTDASGIDAAIYSEPMMSSVAYSVCLVRAKDGTDIEQLKKDIFDKVNAVKWLCVAAEKVLVTNSDNTILLVMTNAEVTEDMYNAFSEVMGGKLGEKLERDGE